MKETKAQHLDIEDSYPLSPMQQGMLFYSLSAPQSAVYIQQLICALHEDLNVSAFERAWQGVVARYSILRTSFRWEGVKEPLQEVHERVRLPLEYRDWRGVPSTQQESQLEAYLRADRQRGFDVTEAPLMRLLLLRLADAEYRCIWTSHHALLDGRSRLLVLKELFAFYEADCQGHSLQLDSPRPYRDYIEWLGKQDFSRAEGFWRQLLKGFTTPTPLSMGGAYQTKSDEDISYGEQAIVLSEALTSTLRRLAQRHQLTPNTFLQGAWALLLSRYSGEEEVVFGATRACRRSALDQSESMVGLFINTLPLRVSVPPEAQLLPWLKGLRAQWMEMRDYEHSPLPKVQQWSGIVAGKPLFESIVVFENYELNTALRAQGGSWKNREFRLLGATSYPLTVTGYLGPELQLKIAYDRHRFDEATISRMLGHLWTLLEGIVANSNNSLSRLPWLTEVERHRLLVEWNETTTDYPKAHCIHQLFEAQAEKTPEAIAVMFGGQQLTYRELNIRANQLAHHLRKRGVGPEVRVGICAERSAEMVVGLLGILKTGGAYVPLDPAYPRERLAFLLEDSRVPVLLTQEVLMDRLPEQAVELVCVDREWPLISQEREENLATAMSPANLAYVIYTSGSTGIPKGVEVTQGGLVNLVAWHQQVYHVTPADRATQLSSPAFDASVWELWPYLTAGASIYLPDEVTRVSPSLLLEWLVAQAITLCFLPTPLAEGVLKEALPEGLALRALLTGGDKLHAGLQEVLPFSLINHYGPTENTVVTTFAPVTVRKEVGVPPPVGRPIANTQVYLLDRPLQPVPIGVAGVLYIGGDGLARGYLNRPDLTAEKFVPNPFVPEPGARLYNTGDLARYLPDGNIEFLGRIDRQVKIRGFRVEPGEVEAVLCHHPAVRESAVIPREAQPSDKRLVAYVVPAQELPTPLKELRSFLKQRLPDYMLPSAIVLLDALPLTPNGKVDRRALPTPEPERTELEDVFVASCNPVEEVLAGIWSEVLGLKQVGRQDNFFELGGHSLLATQVVSRVHKTFHVELPLRTLFETPTVAGLAQRVERAVQGDEGEAVLPLLPVLRDARLPLSFAQQRLWFFDQLEPGSSSYNMQRVVRVTGPLNIAAMEQSLNEILRRHEALRTTFVSVQGRPVQVIASAMTLALPVVDLRELPDTEREVKTQWLATAEIRHPFDLTRGPLLRATLLRLGEEEHLLVLTIHHIVSDGWSMGVFVRELAVLYKSFSAGKSSPLPDLPIQYADFALWQRQWLQDEVLGKQLSYWKRQLGGNLPVLQFPADYPRPDVQRFKGGRQSLVLPKILSDALQALSRQEGVTLFMTLLAAFQTLLHRYTGQDDIIVGSPVAGRNRAETEGLIGFFVNTLVLRTYLSGDPPFRELLGRVREVALGAYAHQDLPFEKLVEELQPERDLSHSPLFQVMFALQNVPGQATELAGLSLHPLEVEQGETQFDLTLSMVEEAGELRARMDYNKDLFEAARVKHLLGHYHTLLEGIVINPEQRLSHLPLLTGAERQQLLGWNRTERAHPMGQTLQELFEAQVERTPGAMAVVFGERQLTYAGLNARANQLAHHLRERGVGPGGVVGVCLERSAEMVVGLLGILKAGGAYLPLDPAHPPQRLAFMLKDAQIPVLLTQGQFAKALPADRTQVVCLDEDSGLIARGSEENPASRNGPNDLAYVIYTSGSTGEPKGVLVSHHNVTRLLAATQPWFQFGGKDVWTFFHSPAFDFSVWEMWGALTHGGRLVVVPGWMTRSPDCFYELMCREQVTVLNQTPSAFYQLLRVEEERGGKTLGGVGDLALRLIIFGGEALDVKRLRPWFERHGDKRPRLVNMYGITETTVHVTYRPLSLADLSEGRGSPIGRPLPDLQLYLLDRHLEPVPVGVPGEIYVGGEGLSLGYLNRPGLSAERFIPHPFGRGAGERLYKTGDLARYLSNGELVYLGRGDSQVKIRGYRIELGEIEAVLGQHPGIHEAVVVARHEGPGEQRLVAYVVPGRGTAPETHELRSFLKERLPEYMVPATFVVLEALPLVPSGKVDRGALPAAEPPRPDLENPFVAPRTPLEKELAEIWRGLLGIERVGICDNFFELGGHSLSLTQLASRIQQAFGVQLPLRTLFEATTITELGTAIATAKVAQDDAAEVAQMLKDIKQLSPDEVRALLEAEG